VFSCFQAPKPPPRWDFILNATEFGPICWQPGEQRIYDGVLVRNRSTLRKRKMENYEMSEDCLTLNIYVPQVRTTVPDLLINVQY